MADESIAGYCVVVRLTSNNSTTFFGPWPKGSEAETYAATQRVKKPPRTATVAPVSRAIPVYLLAVPV